MKALYRMKINSEMDATGIKTTNLVVFKSILLLIIIFLIAVAGKRSLAKGEVIVGDKDKEGKRITSSELRDHAAGLNPLNSLIISVGDTVRDRFYFNGQGKNETLNIKSASKSILSSLVGIALNEGYIDSLNQPIHVFLNDYFAKLPVNKETQKKKSITIRDLLTMSSGLKSTSGPGYGRWVISDDWTLYALKQPLVDEPGEVMDYSTGDSHILSAVLTRATGMSTFQFARRYLFNPMGMVCSGWQRSPEGFYFGGNNVALRPIDLLNYGNLYLNDGKYKGQQIVSGSWTMQSTMPYKESTIKSREDDEFHKFGYLWWNFDFGGYETFFGWGYGGQYVFVVEELDAVAVITHAILDNNQYGRNKRQAYNLLEEWVIPYIEGMR